MRKLSITILVISLIISLSILGCSKSGGSFIPEKKVPITSASKTALVEYQKGLILSDKLQRVQARVHFQKAVEADPEFATAWLQLALVSPGLNSVMIALDSAKAHASGASKAEQILINAIEYGILGMNIEQGEALNEIINLFPGDERSYVNLGNYLYGNQLYQAAIKAYSDAIKINDDLAAPYNMLGYAQRALGNYGEAEKAFKRYIKLNAENANAFDSYAELLLEMGRHQESIEYYRQALDVDSTFTPSYFGIASNYNFMHESEQARASIAKARTLAPNYIVLRQTNFADVLTYVFEGQYMQALDILEQNRIIAEANNDHVSLANDYANMGNIYLELGQADVAMSKYELSIAAIDESDLQVAIKDNAHTQHLFNIARAYAAQGDYRHALRDAASFERTVLSLRNPVQIGLSHQLNGIIALYQEKYHVAIELFEKTNLLNPSNVYRMAVAYEGLGDMETANNLYQQAQELNILNSMDQAMVCSKIKLRTEQQNS